MFSYVCCVRVPVYVCSHDAVQVHMCMLAWRNLKLTLDIFLFTYGLMQCLSLNLDLNVSASLATQLNCLSLPSIFWNYR